MTSSHATRDREAPSTASAPGARAAPVLVAAVLGDVEPKPEPVFPNLSAAVDAINRLAARRGLDFVAGIGDLAHHGTEVQYEAASPIIRRLTPPFYPIVGNEELQGGTERYFRYARTWNEEPTAVPGLRYVQVRAGILLVFASAEGNGKDFSLAELSWLEARLRQHPGKPAVLFIHAAPQGVFPQGKAMKTGAFDRILALRSRMVVVSGHSHMSLDEATTYARDRWGNHHVHAPGIERTKLGSRHVPRFRLLTLAGDGGVTVETYNVADRCFEEQHRVTFRLPVAPAEQGSAGETS